MAIGKSPLQTWFEGIPAIYRNKYLIASVLFLIYMLFFDKHDLVTQFKLQRTVHRLEQDQQYYLNKIEEAEQDRYDLEVNREKFARERYYMQEKDEDVFIIKKADD